MACRVSDLPKFIARANRYREVTGEGLAFLNIPRSYYGFLQCRDFAEFLDEKVVESALFEPLRQAGILDEHGVVKMDVTVDEVQKVLVDITDIAVQDHDRVVKVIRAGRYSNMMSMFKDRFTEEEYLRIVENKILVDAQ